MDLELQGKVAIIGGASKGLGRACAEVLAEEGARLTMREKAAAKKTLSINGAPWGKVRM